jgi:poly(A) polymerase
MYDKLHKALHACPHFDRLLELARDAAPVLVGGALRDALCGRRLTDIDLIFPHDPTPIAKAFARQVSGYWFWLDRKRLQSRVRLERSGPALYYDFAPFRAPGLIEDLRDRDFTINAVALPLLPPHDKLELVDPCGGQQDLRTGLLRAVSDQSLVRDPLRILKGVRHATLLDLSIEPDTLESMRRSSALLDTVAVERVRQEVWQIVSSSNAARGLALLAESGAGEQLFGAAFNEQVDRMGRWLCDVRSRWFELGQRDERFLSWLKLEVEQGLEVATLILFRGLLAQSDASLPKQIARRWRLGRRALRQLKAIEALDARAWQEFAGSAATARACAWWAYRRAIEPQILPAALATTHCSSATELELLASRIPLLAEIEPGRPADLVDGDWLRRELGVEDGPRMAQLLERLRDAELRADVLDVASAQALLRKLADESGDNRD